MPVKLSLMNKIQRVLWAFVWSFLFRPTPRSFHAWRRFLLRSFGANIGTGVHPYPSARIWAPWNLEMADHSCLSEYVDCYSVDKINIGAHAVISQYTFLCTASHDYDDPEFPLITAPINIGANVWVAADVFIGPGVNIGEGTVVGARSSVFNNVDAWQVVAGQPAKFIKNRENKSKV